MNAVTLVTGASRGIGAATALRLARAGHAVAVNYARDAAAAASVVEAIRGEGGDAVALQADVADEAEVLRLFEAIDRRWGRLTGLVNNAGVVDAATRVEAVTLARLQRLFAVNVFGSFLCAREALKRMGAGGAIVNVSSVAARLGSPGEYVDYASAKAAIDTFTRGLALEVAARGIRVNAVRPGIVETEIHASGGQPDRVARLGPQVPMQRAGTADEIAAAIAWLLSDEASYCSGAILDVSGGR
ncbi:MAG TPA: SDR family oxidoreductase [Burkholderiaceae bacterium]|jgi:NAD(P)-dependent dehydrogenase (short-subunit alcohol dehydrogenase family)